MSGKPFKLRVDQIRPLVRGMGGCIATDHITVDGHPVRFMYREQPDNDIDSGWRFFSGLEDEACMADPSRHAVYDVNTIANYDPAILPWLDASLGTAFERGDASEPFVQVQDWHPDED